jgi:hypothetical protein
MKILTEIGRTTLWLGFILLCLAMLVTYGFAILDLLFGWMV